MPLPSVPGEQRVREPVIAELDIAATMNRLYGEGLFTIPEPSILPQVATVTGLDGGRPAMTTIASREYMEKTEANLILRLLKSMVAELVAVDGQP